MEFFKRLFGFGRQSATEEQADPVIAEWTKAIQNDPGDFLAYAARGDAFRERGNLKRAIDDYSAAIECYQGALNFLRTGRVDGAAPLRDALRVRPEIALACFKRGCTYAALGFFAHAITDFNEVIQVAPKREYYLERAKAFRAIGDEEMATQDAQRAQDFGT